MNQTNHFFDLGYGWLCKHCSAADADAKQHHEARRGFFGHAETEKKAPSSPGLALASWTDPSRHSLFCPRCGIAETVTKT